MTWISRTVAISGLVLLVHALVLSVQIGRAAIVDRKQLLFGPGAFRASVAQNYVADSDGAVTINSLIATGHFNRSSHSDRDHMPWSRAWIAVAEANSVEGLGGQN